MPYLNRQVGNVSQLINVFMPDATVSTGAGLANVVASTVRLTWWRDNQAAVSSWLLTTGTLGTWTASTFTQVGSTSTLGMYQVSLPDGMFVSGTNVAAFLMSSTAAFAPVPLIFDLSSQILGVSSISTPVTASSGVVGVSSATIPFGVSSISIPVSVSSNTDKGNYGVSSIVTVGVSSISTPVTASTAGVTSISIPVGVSSGSVRVTSATIPFGVSSLSAAALGNFFDTGALFYSTAVVSSVVFEIATHATATVSGDVGVSSISIPVSVSSGSVRVTSASIPFGVSSISIPVTVSAVTIPVGVSSGSVAVTSATAAVYEAAADTLLARNVSGGANTGRSVKEALYVLRNKVDAGAGIVYATDDTTSSWAFTVSTLAGDPIVAIDPA